MSLLTSLFNRTFAHEGTRTRPRRTALVGTTRTIRQLKLMLRQSGRPVELVGCLLIAPQHRTGALGLPVLGTADDLPTAAGVHELDQVLVSLPVTMAAAARRVHAMCDELDLACTEVGAIDDQLTGRSHRPIGSIDLTELLGRPPRRLDEPAIAGLLRGRRVLVTGAGGSIGSALCRIIARFGPAELQLMERAENNLFEIHRELCQSHPELSMRSLLHDVTREDRTLALCRQIRPQIIFHAAAHKHVPMMEDHPREAVENNLFGTRSIADAAHDVGAERFVMISSDKAVNPTSVMGATKRLAELYIQHMDRRSRSRFTMVRFGNVLGSACSVVPIWERQLADGGPLTVTDPRMTRYFMTIPEAAALVVQAATVDGADGQVMLLDMGQPIRIVDLAHRFCALHGLEPGHDVAIVFTGIRPGEKLFEELAYDSEAMVPTEHESVRIWRTQAPSADEVAGMIERFTTLRHSDDRPAMLRALRQAVPQMQVVEGDPRPALGRRGRPRVKLEPVVTATPRTLARSV